jgi:serine/threonine-protein kinase
MNNQSPVLDEHMSCHSIVLAFEKAFRNIEVPNIDDYRTNAQSSSFHLLLELILSDIELRHRRGAAIPFSHYLSRFPEIETQPEIVIQLIQHDVQLKRQSGVTINPREYPSQYTIPRQPHNVSDTINAISGYEIKHEVGRGGMSTVYLARQASLNRLVALKTLRSENTDSEPRDTIRFLAEAELIGTIRHPNIVQIYDYGATPGESPFLALEYLAGGTLANRLADGPLKPEEAARLVSSLASGIHHAHSLGMVHRDLKPANLLIKDKVTKIADFGFAKRVTANSK